MADPVTRKIDTLDNLIGIAAAGDKMVVIDASDADPVTKTKLVSMSQLSIHTKDQLAANIVENAQIKDGAVTEAKLATSAVTGTKIANDSIDSQHYVDGSIDTAHLANDAVTEVKLGAIKRTVAIPVFGREDAIIVKNFTRIFAWPAMLNGHIVVGASAVLLGSVSSSGSVAMTLTNQNGTMATISIAQGAWSASAGSISTTYDEAASFATFSINVTSAGSGATGLTVYLEVLG